jgi:hypothetical protein
MTNDADGLNERLRRKASRTQGCLELCTDLDAEGSVVSRKDSEDVHLLICVEDLKDDQEKLCATGAKATRL